MFKRTCICAALFCISLLSSAADCVTPAAGLVGWWRAENSGADVTGAHDGSFPYGIAFAGGEAGQAFDFDSSFRRLSIPDSPVFQLTNAMTLEGWVYPRAYGGFICFRGDNRPGLDTWVLDTYQTGFVNFQIDDEANTYSSVRAPIALNQWQHMAAIWDRTNGLMKIYVNGALVTQTNTTVIPISQLDPGSEPAICIGNHGGTFHQFPMNGLVDEFAIYNRALADSEILSIYNASTAGKCLPAPPPVCVPSPAGLVGFWRGDGNTLDAAGNNTGTLTGNATFGIGRVGQGFVFDGDGDLVPVGAAPAMQLQDFTIETWIQRLSTAQVSYGSYGNGVIFGYGQNGYGLYIDPNGVPALSKIGISETKPAASITDTNYHHLAVTKTGSSVVFYIDGAAYSAPDYDPGFTFDTVAAIGARGDNQDNSFLGFVDEVSVYSRALGAIELQSIFNASIAGKCAASNPPPLICAPAPAGLVGFWRADGNPNDSVGTNHGTLVNVAGFAPGETGQALDFSGSVGSVIIPANTSLDVGTGNGFSIETWINPGSIDLERPIVEWNSVTGGNPYPYGVHLWISVPVGYGAGPGCLYANIVDTAGSFHWLSSAGGLITTNRFQHVALTYDKTSGLATLYLDGNQVASQNLGSFTPQTSYNLYLGNRPGGEAAAFSWDGQLDEISLYNRTLSGTEILAIYNAGSAGKCAPSPPPTCTPPSPNLVGWWKAEANASDANGTNHGAALNGVRFTNGVVGQAFYFDGVDDRVLVPSSASLNFGPGADFSVEAWIKPQVAVTDFGVQSIVNKRFAPNFIAAVGWEFGLVDGRLMCQLADAPLADLNFSTFVASGPDLRDGQFHHVALSVQRNNSTGGKLMVDGQVILVFDPTSQPGDLSTTEPLRIGAHADAALNSHLTGAVDDISVYSAALSEADVLAIYNAGSAGKCTVTNPPPASSSVPHITSFSPLVATVGSEVIISGTNFSPVASNNIVHIGAVRAVVTAASPILLTVRVPSGATHAQMTVTVGGLTASASVAFTPTFAGGDAISVGSFSPRFDIGAGNGPTQTVIADLDGDGKPDIAVADDYGHTISLYRNISVVGTLGVGSFAPRVVLQASAADYSPYMLVAGDVDGDAKLDLIATDIGGNTVSVFHNLAETGSLSPDSFAPFISFAVGGGPRAVALLDLDADGRPEIVSANYDSSTVSILRNTSISGQISSNSFAPGIELSAGAGAHGLVVADLDGDGQPDLATANAVAGSVSLFRNLGGPVASNSFSPVVTISGPENAHFLRAADLDGDGLPELLVTSYLGGGMTVYPNQAVPGVLADNSFASGVVFGLAGRGHTFSLGDLNGDAKLDIAVDTELGDSIALFQNQSGPIGFTNASLAARVDLATGWNAWGSCVGDLDGDGRPDIIFANTYENSISIYRNKSGETPVTNCIAPPVGLVAWWQAGSNTVDIAGGNNGTLHSGADFSTGKVNQSFIFNGAGSYVEVPHSPSLVMTNELTIEFWVKRQDPFGPDYIVNKGGDWTGGVLNYGVAIAPPEFGNILHFTFAGGNRGTIGITDLNWHHCAVVARNGNANVAFYVDGVPHATTHFEGAETINLYPSDRPLHIGAQVDPATGWFYFSKTLIDELAIYNRALSAEEIATIYGGGSYGKCAEALQPVAMPDSFSTGTNTPVSFNAGKLLVNDIEPHGLALSVASVSSSSLGGTVELIAGQLHYTPPPDFTGNDVFAYSITNILGVSATSLVTATVGSGGHAPLNITRGPVVEDGEFSVRFAGIPGLTYTIEAAPGVDGPWTKVTNITAPTTDSGFGIGVFEFREPVGAFESRFYRTIYPAY